MQTHSIQELAEDLPFFSTLEERERLLTVIGALALRRISLRKACEILEMDKSALLGILDAAGMDFSYLEERDIEIEKRWS
jgi:predicted HTH domain antitoxin